MAEELKVEVRQSRGKRNNRRLRKAGSIPGVLYGHGKENIALSVPSQSIDTLVARGNRVVSLTGGVSESAFIRDVQWDTWGTHVMHVDLTRVSEHEKVEVRVSVELRGEAPGVKAGGVIEHLIHEVLLECPAGNIPEKLSVSVNALKLDESITLADLDLPEGANVVGDTGAIAVQCIVPAEAPEEGVAEAVSGEPEVIGAKEEESADKK